MWLTNQVFALQSYHNLKKKLSAKTHTMAFLQTENLELMFDSNVPFDPEGKTWCWVFVKGKKM